MFSNYRITGNQHHKEMLDQGMTSDWKNDKDRDWNLTFLLCQVVGDGHDTGEGHEAHAHHQHPGRPHGQRSGHWVGAGELQSLVRREVSGWTT